MAPQRALETIGKTLSQQYKRWQPRVHYKVQTDPTVEEVKKLCNTCRVYAKSEGVLFQYNGHGVPKPTANGQILALSQDCSISALDFFYIGRQCKWTDCNCNLAVADHSVHHRHDIKFHCPNSSSTSMGVSGSIGR